MSNDYQNSLELTPEIIAEFIDETHAQLSKAEAALLAIEAGNRDKDSLNGVFRVFHTIKGTASYLDFKTLTDLARFCEEILDKARGSGLAPGKNVLSWLIKAVDEIRTIMRKYLAGGNGYMKEEFDKAFRDFLVKMSSGITGGTNLTDAAYDGSTFMDLSAGSGNDLSPVLTLDAYKFNSMVNSLNELIVAENVMRNEFEAVYQEAGAYFDGVMRKMRALDKIAAKLNYDSMALKMLPFQHLFNKMIRLIRDLSVKSGKKIQLLLNGGDTEIDREIIENLTEPLIHILRNSVDHGIENSGERLKAGKMEAGLVSISAVCLDGKIVISVSDDGRGLDRGKIFRKAVLNGLIREDEKPCDEKLYGFIMLPGFTTSEKVSELSGRGVGMDAVKKAVEALKGSIKIKSIAGQGTKIIMTFPVNMAVIEGMLVSRSGDRYILPVSNIESVALSGGGPIDAALPGFSENTESGRSGRNVIINIKSGNKRKAILVDRIISQQKIAVANISGLKLEKTFFSGATVMPDGTPALIISPERMISSEA
jgi:two-component system chemotaxis sensor kinase CheA